MPAYFAIVCMLANKCSTVAKMGDRLATIDMDQKLECCAPFFFWGGEGGAESLCNTMWPGPRPTFVQSGI